VKPTSKIRNLVSLAIMLCFVASNSTGLTANADGIQQKNDSGLKPPEIADQLEKKSHINQGNQQWYSYRYYPSCYVYYDIDRSLYYYLEGDVWKQSASLSSNLERKLGDYVIIEMDTDKPYIEHKKHAQYFPPEKSPKSKPNIWSKLLFFLLYEHSSK